MQLAVHPTSSESTQVSQPERLALTTKRHWEMLLGSIGVIVLAITMTILPDQRVVLAMLPDYPLPPLCTVREWFGQTCPGCGLTRSFILFFQGHLSESIAMHRLGPLLALTTVAQVPYRVYCIRRSPAGTHWQLGTKVFGFGLLGLLVVNWLYDLMG